MEIKPNDQTTPFKQALGNSELPFNKNKSLT